jgi:serine/threonine protein phosphatase 1
VAAPLAISRGFRLRSEATPDGSRSVAGHSADLPRAARSQSRAVPWAIIVRPYRAFGLLLPTSLILLRPAYGGHGSYDGQVADCRKFDVRGQNYRIQNRFPSIDMRTLAIGDIHGCHAALIALLAQVQPRPGDTLVFTGDYIDRGPASRQVIDVLLGLHKSCSPVFLRGNHEGMILDAREDLLKTGFWRDCGGLETLSSYGADYQSDWVSEIPDSHWKFFERNARFLETDTHIFVHAYVDAELEMKDQRDSLMLWGYFEWIKPHKSGKKIVCGHTVQDAGKINDVGFAVCIDTGAAMGGWLSCLDVKTGKYWQANESGETRTGELRFNHGTIIR